MFGKQEEKPVGKDYERIVRDLEHKHELEKKELESNHTLAMKEKEFELRHFKDEETQKLRQELADKKQRIAVLEKENEMLDKITNLNADIIDIKDLVGSLIKKLPEINISSLSLHGGTDK